MTSGGTVGGSAAMAALPPSTAVNAAAKAAAKTVTDGAVRTRCDVFMVRCACRRSLGQRVPRRRMASTWKSASLPLAPHVYAGCLRSLVSAVTM